MYTIGVKRSFIAQHFLIGGDWGAENLLHSHPYTVEVQLEGASLDQHGYLVDIVQVEDRLDEVVRRYRDHTLNDLPELTGLNPSVERFARLIAEQLSAGLDVPAITTLAVKLWESDTAWAAYRLDR